MSAWTNPEMLDALDDGYALGRRDGRKIHRTIMVVFFSIGFAGGCLLTALFHHWVV